MDNDPVGKTKPSWAIFEFLNTVSRLLLQPKKHEAAGGLTTISTMPVDFTQRPKNVGQLFNSFYSIVLWIVGTFSG